MKKIVLIVLVAGAAVIANLQSADQSPSSKAGCCAISTAASCPIQAACPAEVKANCAKAGDCAQCECKQCTCKDCKDCKDCADCKECCAAKTANATCPMMKAAAGACAAKGAGLAVVKGGPKLLKINLPVSSGCCAGTAQTMAAGKCPMSGAAAKGTVAQTAPAR